MVDTARGTVLRRIDLPDPVFSGTTEVVEVRELAATVPEGILLWHHQGTGPVELELMDRETGRLTVAARPADDRVEDLRPRGTAG